MKTRLLSIAVLVFVTLIFTSCDNEESLDVSVTDVEETMFAETVYAQLSNDVDEVVYLSTGSTNGRFGDGKYGGFGSMGCVTKTVDRPEDADFPVTITMVFEGDCEFGNVVKSGTIIITLTGPRNEEGSERIVTFEDFYVNGNLIEGTRTHTYLGNGEWTMTMEGGQITNEEGEVMTRNVYRERKRVQGEDTEDMEDDVFNTTGTANGVNFLGQAYTKTILEPLVSTRECSWIVSGIVETVTEEAPTVTIDFGDGTCDNLAIRTVEGEDPEEIEMDCRIKKFHRISRRK